jgi:hypothetical protein
MSRVSGTPTSELFNGNFVIRADEDDDEGGGSSDDNGSSSDDDSGASSDGPLTPGDDNGGHPDIVETTCAPLAAASSSVSLGTLEILSGNLSSSSFLLLPTGCNFNNTVLSISSYSPHANSQGTAIINE